MSWFGVLVTNSLPSEPTQSQAQPLPNRVVAALANSVLNASNEPNAPLMVVGQIADGSPPPLGFMTVQNSEWLTWPPPLLRTAIRMLSGTASRSAIRLDRGLVLEFRVVLEGGVEVVDIGLVVFRVVDLHRARIDVRFEGVDVIGQVGQFEAHSLSSWVLSAFGVL